MNYIKYDEEKGMYYATAVVKRVNKQVYKFLRRQDIKSLLQTLENRGIQAIFKLGGNPAKSGTWMCKELYLELVRWAIPTDYPDACELLNAPTAVHTFLRPELCFGKDVIKKLYPNLEILEQYPVFETRYDGPKYKIDWYIPTLNYAIEFDEPHHIKNYEKDVLRQKEIEEELGCTFIRLNYDPKTGNVW